MSCKVAKYDLCVLQQETFRSPVFDFGETDVSADAFVYSVFKSFGASRKEFPVKFIDEHTVFIEDIKMPTGDFEHELIWIKDGVKEIVFQGALKVTDKGTVCRTCGDAEISIEVVREDITVSVSVNERIINNLVWSGSVLGFEVNGNMQLVMTETVPTPIDFKVTNGFLTLDFN